MNQEQRISQEGIIILTPSSCDLVDFGENTAGYSLAVRVPGISADNGNQLKVVVRQNEVYVKGVVTNIEAFNEAFAKYKVEPVGVEATTTSGNFTLVLSLPVPETTLHPRITIASLKPDGVLEIILGKVEQPHSHWGSRYFPYHERR